MKNTIRICKISPIARGLKNWGPVHTKSLAEIAHGGLELKQIDLPEVPVTSISSNYECDLVTVAATQAAIKAEAEGFDAVVIGCLLEPGVSAAKEALSIPVVGFAEASLHLASLVARRFSFLVPGETRSDRALADVVRRHGFADRIASIRTVGNSPLAFTDEQEERKLIRVMLSEAKAAVSEDGAEAVVGYGGYNVIHTMRKELAIPIINPTQASVIVAEMLVRAKLSQSKIAFTFPVILRNR